MPERTLNYGKHWDSEHPGETLTCFLQWECLVPETCVFLMSGTPVSRWPGTLLPPGLMDTSSSTSPRVRTNFCFIPLNISNSSPSVAGFEGLFCHFDVPRQVLMSPWRYLSEMWPPTSWITWILERPMTWRCWLSTTQASAHLWMVKEPHVCWFPRGLFALEAGKRWTNGILVHFLVYLNVTDLTTYNVGFDSFCLRWAPHRAATSYRLKVNPFDSMSLTHFCNFGPNFSLLDLFVPDVIVSLFVVSKRGAQEVTVRGSESTYCFDGLSPDTLYNATVYTQTPSMEGPGVSVKERTCKKMSSGSVHYQRISISQV